MKMGEACVAALMVLFIMWVVTEALGNQLAPIGDAKPGDPFNANAALQTIHLLALYMPAVIVIGGFARALVLATRPDSQTYVRRR